jgi:anti-anti-sigma regulatory factor
VFHLEDRVNLGNADELMKTAQQAYDKGTRDLVINLSEVPSITSAGLRALLFIFKLLETEAISGNQTQEAGPPQKSAHLKLANPSDQIRLVLKTAGFDRYIAIYDSTEEALASY